MVAEVHAMTYYYSKPLYFKKTSIKVDHLNLIAQSLMRKKSVV
jgi:hypothetical protein